MAFKMRSGNTPKFKAMGSSPVKKHILSHGAPRKTVEDYLNEGFSQREADQMYRDGGLTGHVDTKTKNLKDAVKAGAVKGGVPKPKKSTTTKHGQLNDAQLEYETDKKLYEKYKKKKSPAKAYKKSPAKKKSKKGVSVFDFDTTVGEMPVKTKGLGPRANFGGVKNPELTKQSKTKEKKVMKDGSKNRAHYKGKIVKNWMNRNAVHPGDPKRRQENWEPAFPGADHSKEELKKMTKKQKEDYYN